MLINDLNVTEELFNNLPRISATYIAIYVTIMVDVAFMSIPCEISTCISVMWAWSICHPRDHYMHQCPGGRGLDAYSVYTFVVIFVSVMVGVVYTTSSF